MRKTICIALLAARAAGAQDLTAPASLRYDLTLDGAIAGASIASWILTETAFKSLLAPSQCKVCGSSADAQGNVYEDVNPIDRTIRNRLVWSNEKTADTLSNVV